MTKDQENLKADIERLDDETSLEKIRIFVMGMLAQQRIDRLLYKQHSTETKMSVSTTNHESGSFSDE
ncbi:MAG: hypothetical protein J1E01_05155 [Acetatifactor sp.]|nr:hypothetical protein [Acetatifactor sp.]